MSEPDVIEDAEAPRDHLVRLVRELRKTEAILTEELRRREAAAVKVIEERRNTLQVQRRVSMSRDGRLAALHRGEEVLHMLHLLSQAGVIAHRGVPATKNPAGQ